MASGNVLEKWCFSQNFFSLILLSILCMYPGCRLGAEHGGSAGLHTHPDRHVEGYACRTGARHHGQGERNLLQVGQYVFGATVAPLTFPLTIQRRVDVTESPHIRISLHPNHCEYIQLYIDRILPN